MTALPLIPAADVPTWAAASCISAANDDKRLSGIIPLREVGTVDAESPLDMWVRHSIPLIREAIRVTRGRS